MGLIESSDTLRFSSNKLLIELCGHLDINLSKIEDWAKVQIVRQGNALSIFGAKDNCDLTKKLISDFFIKIISAYPSIFEPWTSKPISTNA